MYKNDHQEKHPPYPLWSGRVETNLLSWPAGENDGEHRVVVQNPHAQMRILMQVHKTMVPEIQSIFKLLEDSQNTHPQTNFRTKLILINDAYSVNRPLDKFACIIFKLRASPLLRHDAISVLTVTLVLAQAKESHKGCRMYAQWPCRREIAARAAPGNRDAGHSIKLYTARSKNNNSYYDLR